MPVTGVGAVVIDVTASNSANAGFLSLYQDDVAFPGTTALTYAATQASTGFTIVALGSDGGIKVTSEGGTPDVSLTVEGYFTSAGSQPGAGGYVPLAQTRLVDTTSSPLAAGATLQVQVSGSGGVPSGANAIFGNVTVTSVSGGSGGLTIWPAEQSQPTIVTMRWNAGTSSSGASIDLAASGSVKIRNTGNQPVIVTIDLDGYFANGSSSDASLFRPVNERIYDSEQAGSATLSGGDTLNLRLAEVGQLPTADAMVATALVISIRNTTASGTITVYSDSQPLPDTASLAYSVGDDTSTLTLTATGVDGGVEIYNSGAAPIDISVDAQGYFSPATLASLQLTGTIYNTNGTASSNTNVTLNALDYSSTIAPDGGIKVAEATTDSSGQFVISTAGCCVNNLGVLRALANANSGYVQMEVWGATSDGGFFANDFPVQLKSSPDGSSAGLAPQTGGSLLVAGVKLQAGRGMVETVATPQNPGPFSSDDSNLAIGVNDPSSAVVAYDGSWQLPAAGQVPADPAYDGPAYQPDGPWTYCHYHGGDMYWKEPPNGSGAPDISRYLYVQGFSDEGNSHNDYDQTWSDGTEMGGAITGAYGYFGAGLEYSKSQDHSMGVHLPAGNYDVGGSTVQWDFHQLRAECIRGGTDNFWMNAYKWTPWFFAGGAINRDMSWVFYCAGHFVSTLGPGANAWVTQNESVMYKGMFSIAGINLNARQTSGVNRKLTWYADATHEAKFCGNDNYMTAAHKVEEIPD